jgi:sulfate transport system permease protein
VRYDFPGKRLLDALVDVPFALPTAVAGLVYASLYTPNGFFGQWLEPLGLTVSYAKPGIVLVLIFTGFPFVVRTVQPVLEDLDHETEQAAATLGASKWQTFRWVIFPILVPPALTGFTLAFARAIGEYGSVVFISANKPFETEIAPMLIFARLEAFEYREAAAIACVLLVASFSLLIGVNLLERWTQPGAAPKPIQAVFRFVRLAVSKPVLALLPDRPPPPFGVMAPVSRTAKIAPNALIVATVTILGVLVVVPLISIFAQAFRGGVANYFSSLVNDPDTRHAIALSFAIAPLAVAMNTVFGIAAAYTIARFQFPGRALLTTLIDIPFSVSPVVAGLVFVLLFGLQSPLGHWLSEHGYRIIFAPPGLVLATAFVTFPFIARELIPVMEAHGPDEEIAARSLGANGWQMFVHVTLPNIKWGLIYGIILCNARAMGEFGAIYVVSGRITGRTDTMPLRVEKLIQDYNQPAAFALASVLALMALITLGLKVAVERRMRTT